LSDFTFITDRIATGAGLDSIDDVQQIADAGITHIIDCRSELDDSALIGQWMQANNHAMYLLWNPTDDDGQPKPPQWFDKSIRFGLHALTVKRRKVYAHCAAGINRGPSTCYAILRATGMSAQMAEDLIRQKRPQVGLAYKPDADRAIDGHWIK